MLPRPRSNRGPQAPTPGRITAMAIFTAALAALPARTELIFVHYDEVLGDDDINRLFSDVDGEAAVWEGIWKSYDEARWHAITHYIEDAVPVDEDRDILRRSPLWDCLVGEIVERDQSDPLDHLLRNTPARHLLYDLTYDLAVPCEGTDEDVRAAVAGIAGAAGIDPDANHAALTELVEGSRYGGGRLFVFWRARDIGALAMAAVEVHGGSAPHRCITWRPAEGDGGADQATAYLLILNRWSGFGCEVAITEPMTKPFIPERISVDSGRHSWNDCCGGLVGRAYDADTDVWVSPDPSWDALRTLDANTHR